MSAVLDLPKIENLQNNLEKAIIQAIKNRFRAVFFDLDYKTYSDLIEKFPERRNPRLTFDRGVLEVMPLPEHDISERLIDSIIDILALELELDFTNYGSSTQNRAKLERGFEPDSSFYFGENAELMRYRDRFLETDPPPDLVFEVDITHSSIDKFPLMAAFGVKEIWLYKKKHLTILRLKNGEYVENESSEIFLNLTADV
ncbi:MAG: Uma2 family endonuclease [Blastocatellia bacterium]|nr:Uma2 family endonuclease [Blastocatellia bacterium]